MKSRGHDCSVQIEGTSDENSSQKKKRRGSKFEQLKKMGSSDSLQVPKVSVGIVGKEQSSRVMPTIGISKEWLAKS